MDSSPTVHRATAFLHCSSVRSWLVTFAFRRDRFGAESAVAGSVTGSFSAGVAAGVVAGNNSGEEDGLREGREKVLSRFWGKVSLGTEILRYARFGGGESFVAGEGDVTVQRIVRVVNIVFQGEYGIEGEVVVAEVVVEEEVVKQEVVGEEVEGEVIIKDVGMVNAVWLVGVEVFVERH